MYNYGVSVSVATAVDGSEVAQALQQLFQKFNLRQSSEKQTEQLQARPSP